MRRVRFPLRFLATVLLALALGVAPVSAAVTTNESINITGTFEVNECTGEGVVLDGRLHILISVTSNPDGSFHLRIHTNTQGVTGIGTISETSYSFARTENLMLEADVDGPGTFHFVVHEEFIHHGEFGGLLAPGLDDKHVHFNIRIVFGGPLAAAVTQSVDCR